LSNLGGRAVPSVTLQGRRGKSRQRSNHDSGDEGRGEKRRVGGEGEKLFLFLVIGRVRKTSTLPCKGGVFGLGFRVRSVGSHHFAEKEKKNNRASIRHGGGTVNSAEQGLAEKHGGDRVTRKRRGQGRAGALGEGDSGRRRQIGQEGGFSQTSNTEGPPLRKEREEIVGSV